MLLKEKETKRIKISLGNRKSGFLKLSYPKSSGKIVSRFFDFTVETSFLFIFAFIFCIEVTAFVMESGSYRIQSDSVNVGGLRSESASYAEESTVGEIATGISDSTSYRLKAGYQQMQESFLSITSVGDIGLSPSLGGIVGGTSNGGAQFRVTTDNSAGFAVSVKTDSDIGMVGDLHSGFIFHLDTLTPEVPNFEFTSAPTNSSAFAFTINASTTGEIVQLFRHNGSACNSGSNEADDNCWIAATTTPRTIISTSSRTPLSGATSTIRFRVVVSESHNPILLPDTYTATTTLTAVAL